MYRIGLKLWSTNTGPLADAAVRLFEEGVFAYIELFAVPDSSETLPAWTRLHAESGIPFVIHNAHTAQGFNLAKREMESRNREIAAETRAFAATMTLRPTRQRPRTFAPPMSATHSPNSG